MALKETNSALKQQAHCWQGCEGLNILTLLVGAWIVLTSHLQYVSN